jgi:hypothetical protein
MTTPTLSEEKIQYSFDAQTWFAKELLAQVMFIVVLAKLIKISLNVFSSERGLRF